MSNFYCQVSHTVQNGVTKIGVTVQREPFARPTDMCIIIKTYRPERAAIRALEKFLILEKASA